jgi:hypothetical protein
MRLRIGFAAVLTVALAGCAAPPPEPSAMTVAEICPAVPEFPAGTRELTPAELRRFAPNAENMPGILQFSVWNSLTLFTHCFCVVGENVEAEFTSEMAAQPFFRVVQTSSGNAETRSIRLRTATPQSPGAEVVSISANRAVILRSVFLAKKECLGTYMTIEPNPSILENRRVADRWVQSLRYRDGTPVPYAPLSGEWTRTRFE